MEVSCGQCLGCRLDRSRTWAMRITHEASLNEQNSFITLTYRNEDLPENWSLEKSHFQKFIKRLRKKNPEKKIKYYHAGEYGNICKHGIDLERVGCPICKLGRPHYHACIFNHNFNEDLEYYAYQNGVDRYTSKTLEEIWQKGFVDVGKLEFKSAAYVARYIMKKVTGEPAKEHYENIDPLTGEIIQLEPEYSTMSNGIGSDWYNRYKKDFFPSDETPVPGNGVFPQVPRYYTEKLKKTNPEMHQAIKERRLEYRKANATEYTSERLFTKYKVKKAQTSGINKRN